MKLKLEIEFNTVIEMVEFFKKPLTETVGNTLILHLTPKTLKPFLSKTLKVSQKVIACGELYKQGKTVEEIATMRQLSTSTVEVYLFQCNKFDPDVHFTVATKQFPHTPRVEPKIEKKLLDTCKSDQWLERFKAQEQNKPKIFQGDVICHETQ